MKPEYKKVNDNGSIRWYNEKDQLHRLGGPAVEKAGDYEVYYENGKLHNLNGPAAVFFLTGEEDHYIEGKYYTKEAWEKEVNKQS